MISALKNRSFLLFFSGFVISDIGNALFYLSAFWFVQLKTGDARYVAWLGLMITIPQLLLFLTGIIADRFPRARVMMVTDILSMLIVLVLAIYSMFSFSFWTVAFLFLFLNICENIFMPASRAFMPQTLPDKDLTAGNSMFAMATEMSTIVAATLGAFLLNLIDETVFFLFNAGTFFISALILIILNKRMTGDKSNLKEQREETDDSESSQPKEKYKFKSFLNELEMVLKLSRKKKFYCLCYQVSF